MEYTIRIADGTKSVVKGVIATKENLATNIDKLFRKKNIRAELVKTFLIGESEITVTDEFCQVVGHGKFTTNVFSGRSDYQIKLY